MNDSPDHPPSVEIQFVGWTGIASPRVQVFIDGECVGVLEDKRARSYSIHVGLHEVRVKYQFARSQALVLSMAAGEQATLECGLRPFHQKAGFFAIQAAMLGSMILTPFNLYRTSMALSGFAIVPMCLELWRMIRPGAFLFLRPQTGLPPPEAPRLLRPPRMTTRRWMIAVAALGVVLGIAAWERRGQHRDELGRRQALYRSQAERHAESEKLWKETRLDARVEDSTIELIMTLEGMKNLHPADISIRSQLMDQKFQLEKLRAYRSLNARLAAYHSQLREKYLRAASRPWEEVEDDPPPPQ